MNPFIPRTTLGILSAQLLIIHSARTQEVPQPDPLSSAYYLAGISYSMDSSLPLSDREIGDVSTPHNRLLYMGNWPTSDSYALLAGHGVFSCPSR